MDFLQQVNRFFDATFDYILDAAGEKILKGIVVGGTVALPLSLFSRIILDVAPISESADAFTATEITYAPATVFVATALIVSAAYYVKATREREPALAQVEQPLIDEPQLLDPENVQNRELHLPLIINGDVIRVSGFTDGGVHLGYFNIGIQNTGTEERRLFFISLNTFPL